MKPASARCCQLYTEHLSRNATRDKKPIFSSQHEHKNRKKTVFGKNEIAKKLLSKPAPTDFAPSSGRKKKPNTTWKTYLKQVARENNGRPPPKNNTEFSETEKITNSIFKTRVERAKNRVTKDGQLFPLFFSCGRATAAIYDTRNFYVIAPDTNLERGQRQTTRTNRHRRTD